MGLLDLELPRDGFIEDPIKTHEQPDSHIGRFPSTESAHSQTKSVSSMTSSPITTAIARINSVQELLDHYIFPSLATTTHTSSLKKSMTLDHPLFVEFCRRCFAEKEGREFFLQALDDRRGRNSELLKEQYERMKIAMKVSSVSLSVLNSSLVGLFGSMPRIS